MRMQLRLCSGVLAFCVARLVSAQDAVKVDPKHYSVITENAQVRILKVHYGAHEKSVMHSHPALGTVLVPTDAKGQFTFADGKTQTFNAKAG